MSREIFNKIREVAEGVSEIGKIEGDLKHVISEALIRPLNEIDFRVPSFPISITEEEVVKIDEDDPLFEITEEVNVEVSVHTVTLVSRNNYVYIQKWYGDTGWDTSTSPTPPVSTTTSSQASEGELIMSIHVKCNEHTVIKVDMHKVLGVSVTCDAVYFLASPKVREAISTCLDQVISKMDLMVEKIGTELIKVMGSVKKVLVPYKVKEISARYQK
ncbi:hypothetical protein B6U74_06015 [Candidatus Bathyarchaeota archaeon ex4484_205]|nr:MAG: hypothetical protein B6U74_06015 [Candidatus Bathyarchaeota archaeon ex4484_205]